MDNMDFWLQPAFPQHRKYMHDAAGNRIKDADGSDKMTHLDGTETDRDEIVCFDYTPEYKKILNNPSLMKYYRKFKDAE